MRRRRIAVLILTSLLLRGPLLGQTNQPSKETPQIVLPAGTPLIVETVNEIKERKVNVGDPVEFRTLREVRVDGFTVIEKNAKVMGKISMKERARPFFHEGKLALELVSAIATDGTPVPLSGLYRTPYETPGQTMHAIFTEWDTDNDTNLLAIPLLPLMAAIPFRADIPEHTMFLGTVGSGVTLLRAKLPPPAPVPAGTDASLYFALDLPPGAAPPSAPPVVAVGDNTIVFNGYRAVELRLPAGCYPMAVLPRSGSPECSSFAEGSESYFLVGSKGDGRWKLASVDGAIFEFQNRPERMVHVPVREDTSLQDVHAIATDLDTETEERIQKHLRKHKLSVQFVHDPAAAPFHLRIYEAKSTSGFPCEQVELYETASGILVRSDLHFLVDPQFRQKYRPDAIAEILESWFKPKAASPSSH